MPNEEIDIQMMKLALEEAQKAAEESEVPVGAVITYKGKIVSTGKIENPYRYLGLRNN